MFVGWCALLLLWGGIGGGRIFDCQVVDWILVELVGVCLWEV